MKQFIYNSKQFWLVSWLCFFTTISLMAQSPFTTFEWALQGVGGTIEDRGEDVATDSKGNVFIVGSFHGTVDFDPSAGTFNLNNPTTRADGFVAKYDSDMNLVWAKQLVGTSAGAIEQVQYITIDGNDNVIISGRFDSNTDFDWNAGTTIINSSGADSYVAKYDNDGNFIWAANTRNGAGNHWISTVNSENDIWVVGGGCALQKYNGTTGALLSTLGSGGPANPRDMDFDENGNIYISGGQLTGTHDFDHGAGTANLTPSTSLWDGWVAKYDVNGNYIWAHNFSTGTPGHRIEAFGIDVSDNEFYITGQLGGGSNNMDMDFGAGVANISYGGCVGAFVAKYDLDANYIWAQSLEGSGCLTVGHTIKVDASGNFYIGTTASANITFDADFTAAVQNLNTPTNASHYYGYYTGDGEYLDGFFIENGATGGSFKNSMAFFGSGTRYIAGSLNGTGDYDPGTGTSNMSLTGGSTDFYLAKYASHQIAITEWMSAPTAISDALGEWMEIYNYGTETVDLSNWTLEDEDGDIGTIPAGTTILPGCYRILAINKTAFETEWLGGATNAHVTQFTGTFQLDNSTDEIILKDANGATIYSLAYSDDETAGNATFLDYNERIGRYRFWGNKATPGVVRAGNDVTSSSLGYEKNNSTNDAQSFNSIGGDTGSPLDGNFPRTLLTDEDRDKALDFDGTNDNVVGPLITNQTTNVCMEAWINPTNPVGGGNQLIFYNGTTNGYGLLLDNAGLITFRTGGFSSILGTTPLNANEWTHVALVHDGTQWVLYQNGIQGNTFAFSGGTPVSNTLLGANNIGTENFAGKIDEFRVWGTSRTMTQVQESMHLTLQGCEQGILAYYQFNESSGTAVPDVLGGNDATMNNMDPTTDWVASTVNVGNSLASGAGTMTVAAGAGTYNFTDQNLNVEFTAHSVGENFFVTYEAFTPNATTGATGTNIISNPVWTVNKATSNSTQTMNMAFTFPASTYSSGNVCNFKLYQRAMYSDGAWTQLASKADGLTGTTVTFNDIAATGQFMVVEDAGSNPDIVRGGALDFDGANDYVNVPHNAVFDPGSGSFTVEAWVKYTSHGDFRNMVSKKAGGGTLSGWTLRTSNTGIPQFFVADGTSNAFAVGSTSLILGRYYHLAGVIDVGSNMVHLYVNGVLEASVAGIGSISNTEALRLGNWTDGGNPDQFSGEMDEVRIWNSARSGQEIRENMHLTLPGCESDLIAYYQMNDGNPSTTLTDVAGGYNGTLTNMVAVTDWIVSSVNVGNDALGNSNSQTITSIPAGASTQNFATANMSINFDAHSAIEDFTVTYQAFSPNAITGVDGINIIQNPMWTVNKSSSTETLLADYTFTFPAATFTSTDPTKYSLYWRAMNSGAAWTRIATANSITSTTAKFTNISLTGQFIVVQESEVLVSDVRGSMYSFDGVDDYITMGQSANLQLSNFTISCWFKKEGAGTNFFGMIPLVTKGRGYTDGSPFDINYSLSLTTGNVLRGDFETEGTGADNPLIGTTTIVDNQWYHAAFTYDGTTMNLYLNGRLEATASPGAMASASSDNHFAIATSMNNTGMPEGYFEGSMDEVRIWSVARTIDQIRENMHLTLKGNETGLVTYYQFNSDNPVGTANGVKDAMSTVDGTTTNILAADYVESEVAVAGGTVDRVTVSGAGVVNFPNTGVSIEFGATHPNGELVVSRLGTEKPHGWGTVIGDVDNEYYVINNYGAVQTGLTPLLDLTFNRVNYINPSDVGIAQATNPVQVYKRNSNDYGATWGTAVGGQGADALTAGTNGMASFNNNNPITEFSQFVLVNSGPNTDLPVELLSFDAERLDQEQVQLDWSTASENNNAGFEIERMLDNEIEFTIIGWLDGQGATTAMTNYQYIDKNTYTGVSYYRLKQMDQDGTFTYSDIRAVAGMGNQNVSYIDVSIYPNPVYEELKVRFNKLPKNVNTANVQIMSVNGQILHDFTAGLQSYQVLEIEYVKQLTPAMYVLSIELSNGEKILQKFIKQ